MVITHDLTTTEVVPLFVEPGFLHVTPQALTDLRHGFKENFHAPCSHTWWGFSDLCPAPQSALGMFSSLHFWFHVSSVI